MKDFFLLVLLCIGSWVVISAQGLTENLDQLLEKTYNPSRSGAAILVAKDGQVIYQNQIGMANVEFDIPIGTQSKFHIGSITKQFTAAALLLLEEQGKLKLDDEASSYLPTFPHQEKRITIAHLLTHSSGIKDYPQVQTIRKHLRNNLSPAQIVEALSEVPLEFEPGTETKYSNSGYIFLGLIIENVSGVDFASFLTSNIFQRLGMHNTLVDSYEGIVENRAVGYSEDENDQLIHATYHTSPFSAGAIVSTVEDLHKWITALYRGELLSEPSRKKMFTNYTLSTGLKSNLGLGWEINQIADLPCFEQSGFVPGYKANSVYIPDHDIYVVVMQNNEFGSPTPVMIQAAALALGSPYPNRLDAKRLSKKAIENIVGTYELEGGSQRIIFHDGQDFHMNTPGGQASALFALDDTSLIYEEGYRQINLHNSSTGRIAGFLYQNRMIQKYANKISQEVPERKEVIAVDLQTKTNLVGTYQFEPFKLTLSIDEEVLFAQPEGANKLPLAPTSASTYTIHEIGAEFTFSNLTSEAIQVSLLLEGNLLNGVRIVE